jgi:hypothetical protein
MLDLLEKSNKLKSKWNRLNVEHTAFHTKRETAKKYTRQVRNYINEEHNRREREGIEIAKAQGKYTGRKPIPTDWTRFGQLYGEWRAKNITGRDFMRRMDMSANIFYRRVHEYELRHVIAEQTSV